MFIVLVGQTRDVKVIKMITKGTIEEQIYQCARQKLQLDRTMQQPLEEESSVKSKKDTAGAPAPDIATVLQVLRAELDKREKSNSDKMNE